MTGKVPLPQPWDPNDEIESAIPTMWAEEIDWFKRGQVKPLVQSLRAGKKIDDNDGELYHMLADIAEGRLKRPRRRPPKYERAFLFGQIGPQFPEDMCAVKESYRTICEQAAFVWHHEARERASGAKAGAARGKAIELAQKRFRLTAKQQDKLESWLDYSKSKRRRLAALKYPI